MVSAESGRLARLSSRRGPGGTMARIGTAFVGAHTCIMQKYMHSGGTREELKSALQAMQVWGCLMEVPMLGSIIAPAVLLCYGG